MKLNPLYWTDKLSHSMTLKIFYMLDKDIESKWFEPIKFAAHVATLFSGFEFILKIIHFFI